MTCCQVCVSRHLLEAAVQVADLDVRGDDGLAVQHRHQAEGAVHGRVGRTDVDGHPLEHLVAVVREVELRLVDLVLGEDPALRRVVVLAQRMPLEGLVGEQAPQVRMPVEAEAEHVVGLALEPVEPLPEPGHRGEHDVVLAHRHLQPQARAALDRVEVVDRLEALLAVGKVDAAEVEHHVELRLRVLLQLAGDVEEDVLADDPDRLVQTLLRQDAAGRELRPDGVELRRGGRGLRLWGRQR